MLICNHLYNYKTHNTYPPAMPPRKRKRPSDQTEETSSPSRPSSSFVLDDDAPPFLNTTFTTHRVSPLHVGAQPLTQDRMHMLSQRLRDLLVGDVVRGVEVGLDRGADDAAMRRAGALEAVGLGWVRLESLVGRYVGDGQDDAGGDVSGISLDSSTSESLGKRRALQITLQYENAECAALLLPALRPTAGSGGGGDASRGGRYDASSTSMFGFGVVGPSEDDADFLHLPLLLLRMPAPLRTVIIDFISRTFDCRISSLSLGTRSLVGALERWMGDSRIPTKGQLAKDVVLSLGFYGPAVIQQERQQRAEAPKKGQAEEEDADDQKVQEATVAIRSIDVIVPNQDLRRFIRAGSTTEAKRNAALDQARRKRKDDTGDTRDVFGHAQRRRLGGDKDEESWAWRRWESSSKQPSTDSEGTRPQPFTEALAQYVRKNLALDMFHPAVRVTKIACGGFALSESRVKIFGVVPSSDERSGLPDTKQRAVWAVLEGLLERAQLKPPDRTLSGPATTEAQTVAGS